MGVCLSARAQDDIRDRGAPHKYTFPLFPGLDVYIPDPQQRDRVDCYEVGMTLGTGSRATVFEFLRLLYDPSTKKCERAKGSLPERSAFKLYVPLESLPGYTDAETRNLLQQRWVYAGTWATRFNKRGANGFKDPAADRFLWPDEVGELELPMSEYNEITGERTDSSQKFFFQRFKPVSGDMSNPAVAKGFTLRPGVYGVRIEPNVERVWNFLLDGLEGLAYARKQRYVNGDIKPANILFGDGEGVGEALDKAHVRMRFGDLDMGSSERQENLALTAAYTPPYIAAAARISKDQKQIDPFMQSHYHDLYSFMATVYELVMSEAHREGRSQSSVIDTQGHPLSLAAALPDIFFRMEQFPVERSRELFKRGEDQEIADWEAIRRVGSDPYRQDQFQTIVRDALVNGLRPGESSPAIAAKLSFLQHLILGSIRWPQNVKAYYEEHIGKGAITVDNAGRLESIDRKAIAQWLENKERAISCERTFQQGTVRRDDTKPLGPFGF